MAGQQPEELLSGVTGGSSDGDTRDRARRGGIVERRPAS